MGRFASTVPYYRRFRQPYPPEFFSRVAAALKLDHTQTLIDLGCGPGLLALGLAPYLRRATGVDPEPGMLAAAREAAAAEGVPLELIESRTEDLPAGLGPFDLATIGRALHWMTPAPTLAVLTRLVNPSGAVVVCGALTAEGTENPWLAAYDEIRCGLSPEKDRRKYGTETAAFFEGSIFSLRETISVRTRQTISVDMLAGRLLSMSNTSPELLGARASGVADTLRSALAAYAGPDGRIDEVVEARAAILTRAA